MSKVALLVHDVRLVDTNLRITSRTATFCSMSVGQSNYLREILPAIQSFGRQIQAENQGTKGHLIIYGHGTYEQNGMIFCNENLILETVNQFNILVNLFDHILLSGCSVLGNAKGFQTCSSLSRVTNSIVVAPTLTQFGGVRVTNTTNFLSEQNESVAHIRLRFDGPTFRFSPPNGQRQACGNPCVPPNLQ